MSTSIRTIAMLPLFAVMLTGCSSSDDSSDTTVDGTLENDTSQPAPNPNPSPTVLNTFDGTYILACALDNPADASEGSEVITTSISGDTAISTLLSYTDTACTTPDIPAEIALEISIVYPGDTVETARGTADAVNLTVESLTIDGVAPTPEQQTALNGINTFDTTFDILLLEDSALFAGDINEDFDGTTAENRPTTLESVPSIRQ